jgi:hypothetical protein
MPAEPCANLDTIIEEALCEKERLRAVPLTLHRQVMERVRIAAMRKQERLRFWYCMGSFCAACMLVLGAAVLLLGFQNPGAHLFEGLSGIRGQLDYHLLSMGQAWTEHGAYAIPLVIIFVCATSLVGLFPLRSILQRVERA